MTSLRHLEAPGGPIARVLGEADLPVVAFALHAGHAVRDGLQEHLALSEAERLREEDPFTTEMAPRSVSVVEVLRSRFEVDLNRPRFRAVYQGPSDAWGMRVWRHELPDAQDRISRAVYDAFYAGAFDLLSSLAAKHDRFVVLDLHSYNHRREGVGQPPACVADNPEVNLGTRHFDRALWAPVIDGFLGHVGALGIDVRENVKFGGGHFAHWVADTFPEQGCVLAIEFKKTYMDEWTGEPDEGEISRYAEAMETSIPVLVGALGRVGCDPSVSIGRDSDGSR